MATDPTWKDRMARASFRGFDFLTDSHDAKGGRRLVVHEFPGAESPAVEDLGAKAWDWKINAYFLGANYDKERNGFLAKLAEPGADWLRHPWLGLLWVRAHNWSVHESNDKGGFCSVSLEFVEGGESVQPLQDRVDTAYLRVSQCRQAAQDDFTAKLRPMSATAMTDFLAAVSQQLERVRSVIAYASLPLTWASQIKGLVAGIKGDIAALMALPAAYASAFSGLSSLLGGGADDASLPDTARPRVVSRLTSLSTEPRIATASSSDPALRANLVLEASLRNTMLAMGAAELALADYQAEGDRDAALASVVGALDALLPTLADPVFQAAVAARTAVIEALMAQDLQPAVVMDVVGPLPAVVLAHRLGIDEDVFLARNQVRHPLFVRGLVNG